MDLKHFKLFIFVLAAFSLFVLPVNAAIDTVEAEITPATAYTTSALNCGFTVTGNESSYTVDVTWFKDGVAHTADDETITASNDTLTNTAGGDIEASDTAKGQAWICQVTADDGNGNIVSENSSAVTIQNTAPVITSSPSTSARTQASYTYTVIVSDADSDSIDYSLTTAPTGMTISSTGLISWTPAETQVGNSNVIVEITDGTATDTQSFTISVTAIKLAVNRLSADCSPENCDDDGLDTETGGTIADVRPGSTLQLEFRLENLWDSDEDDHDIENIEIEGILEELDSEDEQEVTEDVDDIEPGDRSSTVTLEYEIPEDIDEDTYQLEVTITGEDEDGTDYEIEFTIDIEVAKENHKLWIKTAELSPSTISCNRQVDMKTFVKNIGSKDEDDVQLTIISSPLDISVSEFFDLESGDYDDDDTEREETYSFLISDDVKPGTYNIEVRAYYEDDDEYERAVVPLVVQACSATTPTQPEEEEEEEETNGVEIVVTPTTPTTTQTTGPAVAQPVTTATQAGVKFTDSNAFIVLLVVAIVALLIVGAIMVYVLLKD